MTRIRIEGLLAAFPKLVGAGKQHTYVETENVRYVYQPIEVTCQFLLSKIAISEGKLATLRSFIRYTQDIPDDAVVAAIAADASFQAA